MADDAETGALDEGTENAALREALAAEHAAVWGYGVVGAALAVEARPPATAAETAHRDVRDQVMALLEERAAEPVVAEGAYSLPFPVPVRRRRGRAGRRPRGRRRRGVGAGPGPGRRAGRSASWPSGGSTAAEARAVALAGAAGTAPVTTAFPGLPGVAGPLQGGTSSRSQVRLKWPVRPCAHRRTTTSSPPAGEDPH